MVDLQETVGTVIRRERQERRLTMKELAARSALSEVYLSEIERGKKYPSALVLERLAEALGLDVAELLEFVAESMREAAHPKMTRAAESLREAAHPTMTRAIGFTVPDRGEAPPRVVVKRLAQALGAEDVTMMAELGAFFMSRRSGGTGE
ncbi:MAG: helix-turn-helix domain-containing protein [Chloroflexota bacterium]